MPKTNFEENIREVIGNYVMQLIQHQTALNQLQEQHSAAQARITELEEEIKALESRALGPRLVIPKDGLPTNNPGDPSGPRP